MKDLKLKILQELIAAGLVYVSNKADKSDWFVLKNGNKTPIFFTTHRLNAYPKTMKKIVNYTIALMEENNIVFDSIAGASYGGILYAMWVSYKLNKPSLCIRKEGKKDYDDKGEILGITNKGDKCILFEDATVSGGSSWSFVKILGKYDVEVPCIITLLDAELGVKEIFAEKGIKLYNLFTWREMCDEYMKHNDVGEFVHDYIEMIDKKCVEINIVTQQVVLQTSMQLFKK